MRIHVNVGLCQGYGNCVVLDPEHFDLDDDELVVVLKDSVSADEQETTEAAIRSCPVKVLRLEDD